MIDKFVVPFLFLVNVVTFMINIGQHNSLKHNLSVVDSLYKENKHIYEHAINITNYADSLGKDTYARYHSTAGYKVEVFTNSHATPSFTEDERCILIMISKENMP